MKYIFFLLICTFTFSYDLHLGVEDSWPPYALDNGQGISTTKVLKAFKKVGLKPKISVYPYARVLKSTYSGDLDGCYNVTKQDNTNKKYIFGKEPLLRAKASFFYKRGKEKQYKSLKDFPNGTTLAVIRGYEYGDIYEKHKHRFNLIEVNSQFQIINLLTSGRAQASIMFDEVAKYHLDKANKKYALTKGNTNHISDIYVAFSRKNPKSKFYAQKLDEGLRALKKQVN